MIDLMPNNNWRKAKYDYCMAVTVALEMAAALFLINIIRELYKNNWSLYDLFWFDIIILGIFSVYKIIYVLIIFFDKKYYHTPLKEVKIKISPEILRKLKAYEKNMNEKQKKLLERKKKLSKAIAEENFYKKYKRIYSESEIYNPEKNENVDYWKVVYMNKKLKPVYYVPIKKKKK